jgi:hypothetical protein
MILCVRPDPVVNIRFRANDILVWGDLLLGHTATVRPCSALPYVTQNLTTAAVGRHEQPDAQRGCGYHHIYWERSVLSCVNDPRPAAGHP